MPKMTLLQSFDYHFIEFKKNARKKDKDSRYKAGYHGAYQKHILDTGRFASKKEIEFFKKVGNAYVEKMVK